MKTLLPFVGSFLVSCAGAAQWSFDLRPAAGGEAAPEAAQAPAEAESGLVSRAVAPLAAAPAGAALAPGDAVSLLLADGSLVELTLAEACAAPLSGGRVFLARGADDPALAAVVAVDAEGALTASVSGLAEGRILRVFPQGGATVSETADPGAVPFVEEAPLVPEAAAAGEADGAEPALPTAADQNDQTVDVLVGFDKGAIAWAKNNGGTTNFAEVAVQRMNLALANSNLDGAFRYRLVGIVEVPVVLDTAVTVAALNTISGGRGDWAPLHAMREETGADVVTVLIDTGVAYGTCGLAWELKATTAAAAKSHASSAFNVCAIRSVAISHTMTHEVGHNLGCGHSTLADDPSNTGPAGFPYSSGYHFTGTDGVKYHTIMAYNAVNGVSYQAANVFSSPDLTVAGVAAGTADKNDNRRALSQTWPWAQAWRDQVIPLSYDVFFSPEGNTLINGSVSVTLTPGKAGLPIRYTLDGSEPTLSSALYSGPITLTKTTTIRASTVVNGNLSRPCTARYLLADLGEALDAPQLTWTCASSSNPWTVSTTYSYDGVACAKSGTASSALAWPDPHLETTITGPTRMSFRYSATLHWDSSSDSPQGYVAVTADGKEVWTATPKGAPSAWALAEVSIPEGSHKVQFRNLKVGYSEEMVVGREYGFWVDNVRFDALSAQPTVSPATTAAESTAATFAHSQTVTISADDPASIIFYTLDGSDPAEEGAIRYTAPFEISDSTLVQAIAIDPGREASAPVSALYLERHRPVLPGEWTANADGLVADAAADSNAKLIVAFLAGTTYNLSTTRAERKIIDDPAFLAWCGANGVYLLDADALDRVDVTASKAQFETWRKVISPNSYGIGRRSSSPIPTERRRPTRPS